jgi:hypothetical protein
VGTSDTTSPANKNYARLNAGARRHYIYPRRGRSLKFKTGYISKTTPRTLSSRAGGRSGTWKKVPFVDHPGFEPRDFEGTIAKKHTPRYKRVMEVAMVRAAKVAY